MNQSQKEIHIRAAQPGDFDAIQGLFRQLWPDKEMNKTAQRKVFNGMLGEQDYELVCAELQGETVGFASVSIQHNFWEEGFIAYITTMIVDERFRSRGIGTALLREIEKRAEVRGCRRVELESAYHRTAAHAFYEKNGFAKRAHFFSKKTGGIS
jgi:ribosomal protein S18 acetylase RimI-like enzyme